MADAGNTPTIAEQQATEQRILQVYVLPITRLLRQHARHLEAKLYPTLSAAQQQQWLGLNPTLASQKKPYNRADFLATLLAAAAFFAALPEKSTPRQLDNQRRAQQLCACYGLMLTLKEGDSAAVGTPRSGQELLQGLARRIPHNGFSKSLPSERMAAFRQAYLTMQPILMATQDTLAGFFSIIFKPTAKVTLTNAINTKLGIYHNEFVQTAERLLGRPQ